VIHYQQCNSSEGSRQ